REAAARRDGSSPWFGSWRAVGAVLLFSAIAGGVAALVAGAGPRPTSSSPAPLRAAATPVARSAGIAAASAARPAPSSGADVETGAASRDAGAGGAGADEVSPAEALPSEAEIASCFERQLPEGSLRKPVDLTWLCPTTDPLAGAARLRSAVVAAGAKGPATPAMRISSRLGPYGMAAFTVVRGACCPEAAPLELPASGRCEPLAPILVELGGATAAGDSIEPIVVRYRDALRCQVAQGQAARLGSRGRPAPCTRRRFAASWRPVASSERASPGQRGFPVLQGGLAAGLASCREPASRARHAAC
ncbi:MAG TPA: hypothetical protein PLU22_20405, partial [Polyangiaceae bacterium]|nr:hypothetical protein [Polyangiaceae bacterium]